MGPVGSVASCHWLLVGSCPVRQRRISLLRQRFQSKALSSNRLLPLCFVTHRIVKAAQQIQVLSLSLDAISGDRGNASRKNCGLLVEVGACSSRGKWRNTLAHLTPIREPAT